MDDNEGNNENAEEECKPQDICVKLIVKRHFVPDASSWPHDRVVDELHSITHVRLDRERIGSLDNLLLFSPNVTNVYLQHNLVEKLDGLECLINARFITLAFNRIKVLGSGLNSLKHLGFLDLSHNEIAKFDHVDFPQSLIVLNLTDNPCTTLADYRSTLLQYLPQLKQLDSVTVANDDGSDDDEESTGDTASNNNTSSDVTTVGLHFAASSILMRSQQRIERLFDEHKSRLQQLDDLRLPTPSGTSRLDSSGSSS